MAQVPDHEFGKRRLQDMQQSTATKRSNHIVLLLMGTIALGGGAYTLMPGENCGTNQPGMAASPEQTGACQSRSSSSSSHGGSAGGSSARSNFASADASSGYSSGSSSSNGSTNNHVTRGGFGSFAHSFTSHFSGGG
jgi:hypothetical protein